MPPRARRIPAIAAALTLLLSAARSDDGDKPDARWREGFESSKTSWRREQTDATVSIGAHERSNRAAHEGRQSERFGFRAGAGSVLYYSLPIPRIPLADDTYASVYVRFNRPGVQLFGRMVLPADLDPETGRPSFLLVPGGTSKSADRWERLELKELVAAAETQARTLRVGSNRRVSLEGAYLERLVVNLYGGAGETEVFLDEATAGPLAAAEPAGDEGEGAAPPVVERPDAPPGPGRAEPKDSARVRIVSNQILRDNADWVPSVIDAPGADPLALRQALFDVVMLPLGAPAQMAEQVVRAGLMIAPTLDLRPGVAPETVIAGIESYPYLDHVAFWNLGDELGATRDLVARKEELERVRKVLMGLHDLPPGRPRVAFGTVEDLLPAYALAGRNLDLMGIAPRDWATIRNPLDTQTFLAQRRNLTAVRNPHAPYLAHIQAAAPPHATRNIWGVDAPPSWGRPQVQPDQIRLQVYEALAAGYRAFAYHADAEITSEAGRPRLLEMALLNAEIDLVEPLIARGSDPIQFWNTFDRDPEQLKIYNASGAAAGMNQQKSSPLTKAQKEVKPHDSIKCASIPTVDGRGRLLMVADFAVGAQHQPPQMAVNDLKVMVQAPENSQALEITPAGIQVLPRERVTGGLRFTIPMFSGTAMILVTTDLSMKAKLEAAVMGTAPKAAAFAIEQGRAQLREVAEVNAQLARDGHPARDADDLLGQADDHLKSAVEASERLDFSLAWFEARWAGRALRVLQREHFRKAARDMEKLTHDLAKAEERKGPYPWITVVACPPLTTFQTLPEAYTWIDTIRGSAGAFGENLVPSGQFDDDGLAGMKEAGWTDVSHATESADTKIEVIEGAGYGPEKNAALRLLVAPKSLDPKQIDKVAPFLDHEAAAVRTPPIPVVRDGLYRIRVLVRLNRQLPSATGGLIVRDSLGGRPYEFRATDACPLWREVTLYRLAPEDGTMTVTLGLAGYTDAYFDRLRVDAVTPGSPPRPAADEPLARRMRPPNPSLPDSATTPRR